MSWMSAGVNSGYSYNNLDAIWKAANYLCVSGAGDPARLRGAIWAYNHADWYVDKVLAQSAAYEAAPAVGTGDARALAREAWFGRERK